MSVQIQNSQREVPVNLSRIRRILQCCLRQAGLAAAEVSVLLTDDPGIRELNRRYRRRNRATDILSFGMREARATGDGLPPHPEILGDLVVSMPTVLRQACVRRVPLQEELDFILVHGLLHLVGYDHASLLEERRMHAYQAALLAGCRRKGGG